jgi:hypothetical protein
MQVVAEHPSEIMRDQYLMVVADRCRVDPQQLRSGAWNSWGDSARGSGAKSGSTGRARVGGRGAAAPPGQPPASGPEFEALRLLVHRPEVIAGRLHPVLFDSDLAARAYLAHGVASDLHDAIAGADPEVADLLQRLAVEDADEDVDDVVIRLIERAGQRALADLERDARAASLPQDYGAVIAWLKLALAEILGGHGGRDGESVLVAWLVSRFEVA